MNITKEWMMKRTMLSALVAALVLFVVPGRDAGAADESRSRHLYGMVGLAAGQTVRLNVVNTWPPGPSRDELPPGPIRVRLSLLDGDGRLLGTARAELTAGQSTSLDLDFARLGVDAQRVPVRAMVDVIWPPGPSADPGVSTLEIVDNDTARTSLFVHPALIRGFNPQPDPPRE